MAWQPLQLSTTLRRPISWVQDIDTEGQFSHNEFHTGFRVLFPMIVSHDIASDDHALNSIMPEYFLGESLTMYGFFLCLGVILLCDSQNLITGSTKTVPWQFQNPQPSITFSTLSCLPLGCSWMLLFCPLLVKESKRRSIFFHFLDNPKVLLNWTCAVQGSCLTLCLHHMLQQPMDSRENWWLCCVGKQKESVPISNSKD